MDTQPLKLQIDSKEARADLDALARALDQAGNAVGKMEKSFATGMSGVDRALKTSMGSMEKFVQVAGLLGKVQLSGDPAKHVRDFANAMNALSRAKAIDTKQITSIKTLSATLSTVKVPSGAARLTEFLNAVGSAKAPSSSSVQRINELLKVLGNFKAGGATRNTESLSRFFATVAGMKVPSAAAIARLETMFKVLNAAKGVPNAQAIVHELDMVAAAAGRAGAAMNTLPKGVRGISPAMQVAEQGTRKLHTALKETPAHAESANKAFGSVGNGLSMLGERFKLSYQLGTVFSAMFSAFTVGQFVKGLYDANVELLKLQKALLFQTGTMEGAHKATDEFIGITDKLGLSMSSAIEAYGRFSISAKASGIDLKQTNDIYRSIGTALQVVGADSHQTGLAFFALTEMMQKGTVHSKEFNRQLGQQIPGNAALGATALSHLLGRYVSVAEFFQQMQRGQIFSNLFVPEYARTVEAMYKPLLGLVKLRPDAALNTLKNSFILFAREVGNAGFLGALSTGLTGLHDKLVYVGKDGVEHLQPKVAELANTMGKNLASMIHALTQGLEFLATHLDSVVLGFKAILGLKIAGSFMDMVGKADVFTAAIAKQSKETLANARASVVSAAGRRADAAAAKEQAAAQLAAAAPYNLRTRGALAAATAGNVIAAEAPLAGKFSNFSSAGTGIAAGGSMAAVEAEAARRALLKPKGFYGVADMSSVMGGRMAGPMGAVGPFRSAMGAAAVTKVVKSEEVIKSASAIERLGGAVAGFGMAAGGIAKTGVEQAVKGIAKFGAFLPGIGTIAIAAGIALAVFSDQITEFKTKAGAKVKIGDLTSGFFDSITAKMSKWFGGLLGFGDKFEGQSIAWGKVVALFLASTETVIGGLFTLASSIGKVFGTAIATVITLIADLGIAVYKAAHGNFAGAKEVLGGIGKDISDQWKDLGSQLKSDFKIFDSVANYNQIVDAGGAAADKRTGGATADASTEAVYKNAEEQLAISQRQQEDEQARGEIEQFNRRLSMGDKGIPKIADILAKIDETAGHQAAAANSTAAAAQATATAATTASAAAKGVGGAGVPAAPAAIAAAIHKASAATGVDESLLTRIAFKESSFNPNARPRDKDGKLVGTAGGLFQFNDATAEQLQLKDRFDPEQSAVAAARLAKINGSFLQSHLGREATGGEVYSAHFLGAAGATNLAKAVEEHPDAIAADKFKDAASANPDVFYANSKNKTGALTMRQVMDKLNAVGGADKGLTGKLITGASPTDEETLTSKLDTALSSYQKLIGQHNPAQEATSQYNEFLLNIEKIQQTQAQVKAKNPTMEDFVKHDEVDREEKRLKQLMEDAANPFSKQVRVEQATNDLTVMRLKNLQDEADFQVKLNALKEQGYDVTLLDTKANRDAVKDAKDRTDALKANLDVITATNAAQVAKIARTGSAQDVFFSQSVKPEAGQTYQQAVAAMEPGELAARQREAGVKAAEHTAGAASDIRGQIVEMQASSVLNPTAKQLRTDYKGYLEQLTGISNASLDELEKRADPALVALAKHAAEVKQALENPPGFQKWVSGLEPLSKRLEDIKANFAETLSSSLTDALMGEKVDWHGAITNISKQIVKAQVDEGLKGVMGFFGIGKKAATPEAQATIDAASATEKAATATMDAATAASQNADKGATALDTSATNLNSAASNLNTAAQAIATAAAGSNTLAGSAGSDVLSSGGAGGGGFNFGGGSNPFGGNLDFGNGAGLSMDNIGSGMNFGSGLDFGGSAASSAAMPNFGIGGGFAEDPSTPGGFIGQAAGNMMSNDGAVPLPLQSLPDLSLMAGPQTNVPDLTPLPDLSKMTSGGGGIMSSLGGLGNAAMSAFGIGTGIYNMFHHKKPPPVYKPVNGVIGESRPVDVTGREIAAHANPIGTLLSAAVSMAGAHGFGAPGGNLTSFLGGGAGSMAGSGGMGSWLSRMIGGPQGMGSMGGFGSLMGKAGSGIGSMFGGLGSLMGSAGSGIGSMFGGLGSLLAGLFSEGGYATQPVTMAGMYAEGGFAGHPAGSKLMAMHAMRDIPHYQDGTPNTSGGMPAILHPNEAVIPLSRGRSIPVDLGDQGGGQRGAPNVTTHITVIAPNPNAFRQSSGSIQRQTNRDMKRAANRNLTP